MLRGSLTTLALGLALLGACSHARETHPAAPASATELEARARLRAPSPHGYEWFTRAEVLRARGELSAAIRAYRLALASADEDPHVVGRLATALDEVGLSAEAEALLREGVREHPRAASLWLARAAIAERRGDLETAIASYERAELLEPTAERAPLALALLLRTHGSPERALAVLDRFEARTRPFQAQAAQARLLFSLENEDSSRLAAAARALVTASPAARRLLEAKVRELLDGDRAELAWPLLLSLPEGPETDALRLQALVARGQWAAAESLLATRDPERLGGLLATARAELAIGRAQRAHDLAHDALLREPTAIEAQLLRAQALLALGKHVAAAQAFAELLRDARTRQEAREGLSLALFAQGLAALAREVRAAQ